MKNLGQSAKELLLKSDTEYRAYCQKESDEAYTVANSNQAEYDKQLLALSAGLLGVLLAFIKDITPLKDAVWKQVLHWSYGLLGACVLSVLLSFQLSIFALKKVRTYWKAEYNKKDSGKFPSHWDAAISIINVVNGAIFAAGLACALLFVIKNMVVRQ